MQRSGMCASSATAEDSYRKYGPAHDCGTSLLSQRVYKIADRGLTFKSTIKFKGGGGQAQNLWEINFELDEFEQWPGHVQTT